MTTERPLHAPIAEPSPKTRTPQVRHLALPGPERRWRYDLTYWTGTLVNLMRPHRIRADPTVRYAADVQVTPAMRTRWADVLGEDAARAPLLFNQGVGTLLVTRVFADLRINFRHLRHVTHEVRHVAPAPTCATAERQHLVMGLVDAVRLGEDRALVTVETEIRRRPADGGDLLAALRDSFMILRLPARDLAALPVDERRRERLSGLRRRRPRIDVAAGRAWTMPIELAPDLGSRYGRIAGDRSPYQTTPAAARLFGHPRPFAQGLALRNLVVTRLAVRGHPLDRLRMTFAAPAWLGQTVQLHGEDDAFEVVDPTGQLVAFGDLGTDPA